MSYEEVFIPEPIREIIKEPIKEPIRETILKVVPKQENRENILEETPEQIQDTCFTEGLEGKVFMKNYYRLIVQCDSIDKLLYLDLFGKKHKLSAVYDRYGRIRKGTTAKLSAEYEVYRLTDVKDGNTCIVKLQDIKCNRTNEILGRVYSLWEAPESTEPYFVGITV